jgi:phosphocarrier protein
MFEADLVVKNKTGLHARPASDLVSCSLRFESEITIFTEDEKINAKSIISVLSGGIYQGTSIKLQVEGPDENVAGKTLVDLLNNMTD